MKYLFQFALICAVAFTGELIHVLIPLPVPGSVYGMILLLLLLLLKIIHLEWVEDAGEFLIGIMPLLFVQPLVSVMNQFDAIAEQLVAILIMCTVVTVVVALVTGYTAQIVRRLSAREKEGAGK